MLTPPTDIAIRLSVASLAFKIEYASNLEVSSIRCDSEFLC